MQIDQVFGDGEAKARPTITRGAGPIDTKKPLEDVAVVNGFYADTCVLHNKATMLCGDHNGDTHRAPS